jgi:hypothetical protein
LGLDVADKISDTVDIVSKGQTTESFDNYYTNSFLVISRSDVSKAHCQHNCRTPVITPSILFIPWAILKVHFCDPTTRRFNLSHENEYQREKVRKNKIEQKDFSKPPILLLVKSIDIGILYSLDSFKAFRDFQEDDKPEITDIVKKTNDKYD